MKQCVFQTLFAGVLLTSLASGQDQANMEIVSALTKPHATTSRIPTEASQNALEWDRVIFSRSHLVKPEQAKAYSGRRLLGGGIDFIAQKYSTSVPFETLQTEYYWLLRVSRKAVTNQSPTLWTRQMLGLAADVWRAEPATKGWHVMRHVPVEVKIGVTRSYRGWQAHERYLWERTLRVMENDTTILVYVEKVYSNRPRIIGTDLDINKEWFKFSENPHDLLGRKIRYHWWQFWRW